MIEIKVEGPAVTLRCEGKVGTQLAEFAAAFHAWAYLATDETDVRDVMRNMLVNQLNDDDLWHSKPGKIETLVEVDGPEDLFNQGWE